MTISRDVPHKSAWPRRFRELTVLMSRLVPGRGGSPCQISIRKPTRRCVLIASAASMLQVGTPSVAAEPVDNGSPGPELRLLLRLGAAPAESRISDQGLRQHGPRSDEGKARRAQRFGGLSHSANRGLRHRGPRSCRRAQTVPQRQAERNRACRSRHAGRLSRHGGRERGAVRRRDVWARRTTHLHAISSVAGNSTESEVCRGQSSHGRPHLTRHLSEKQTQSLARSANIRTTRVFGDKEGSGCAAHRSRVYCAQQLLRLVGRITPL